MWVSVNERLPGKDDFYLCSIKEDYGYSYFVLEWFEDNWFDDCCEFELLVNYWKRIEPPKD